MSAPWREPDLHGIGGGQKRQGERSENVLSSIISQLQSCGQKDLTGRSGSDSHCHESPVVDWRKSNGDDFHGRCDDAGI